MYEHTPHWEGWGAKHGKRFMVEHQGYSLGAMSTNAGARANRERSFNMEPVLARKTGWSVAVQVVTIKKKKKRKGARVVQHPRQ